MAHATWELHAAVSRKSTLAPDEFPNDRTVMTELRDAGLVRTEGGKKPKLAIVRVGSWAGWVNAPVPFGCSQGFGGITMTRRARSHSSTEQPSAI